ERGAPATRLIVNQDAERWSLLPAISIEGLVALTTTIETFQGPQFEQFKHFLEFDLLPRINRYPDVNSVIICDNSRTHRRARTRQLCDAAGV
ncbi:hypothetical protein MJO29_001198, partial [Puccinia striiformis f. sp. tritici]